MASTCPKCRSVLADDAVCCADVKYTWKCRDCGKLTTGFVVPYGRCFLCAGEIEVVEGHSAEDGEAVQVVEEAAQYEVDMYQLYRLALGKAQDPHLREVLTHLYEQEQDHIAELEEKYHIHLEPQILEPSSEAGERLSGWLFEGVEFGADEHIVAVYDKALELERRTRDHFRARAESLPEGTSKEVYRELAAEEEEHVALLETERDQLVG